MKEYRIKKGVRLSVYVFASLAIVLYGGLTIALIIPPFNTITEEMHQAMPGLWLTGLFLAMVILMIVSIISTKKRKIILADKSIISIGLWGKRELKFADIKGFRLDRNPKYPQIKNLIIEPIESKMKSINVGFFLKDMDDLKSSLDSKLKDLDADKSIALEQKYKREEQEILQNNDFGFTIEEREEKLKKAHLFVKVLNGITAIVVVWLFFYPRPYKYAVIACVSLPLIGFLSVKFWKGLIQIDVEKGSVYPTVAFPILFPGLILGLRVMLDFSIEKYSNIWIPAIVISCIYAALVIVSSKKMSFKNAKAYFSILSYVAFGFLYGYSTVVATNCVFDNSEPKVFASEVLGKTINESRKSKTYYLNLSPWGEKTEAEKISVDSDLYNNIHTGDKVSVYQFKGRLDIPWVVVGSGR